MKALITHFALVLALVLCGSRTSHAHGGATAYAIPLSGITIDGKLDDWPKDITRYQILNHKQVYGPTDIDDADLTDSPDLTPEFMVGFSPDENLLYLAVRVRDDALVVNTTNAQSTDACEVYIDGDNSGGQVANIPGMTAEDMPSQQYIMCPPGGSYGSVVGPDNSVNPVLARGDISLTKTKVEFGREGDITVYEWAIEVHDRFPGVQAELAAGKTIGFEIVVIDKDSDTDRPAWICWAPFGTWKYRNADLLGDLVLIDSYADLGTIAGTVTKKKEKVPHAGLIIEAYRDDHKVQNVKTDAEGRYHLKLQPGEYTLKVPRGQGVMKSEMTGITVKAGQETNTDLAILPIKLPETLVRSMALYKSLKGYRDTTAVETRMVKPGMDNRMTSRILFAFERPNRIRSESIIDSPMGGVELFSNGEKMVSYMGMWKQYTENEAPEVLTSANLQMVQSFVVKNIMMSDDPLKDMKKDIYEVKEVGSEKLDGISTTIVELIQPVSSLGASMVSGSVGEDMLIPVRLWIGSKDYLVRKVAYDLDMEQIAKSMPEEQRAMMGDYSKGLKISITEMHTEIDVDPVFSDKDFAFIPPEGAQLVDNFSPPGRSKPEESKSIGKPAPDFALTDIDGNEAKLADFEGKVVLVDFWATWCGPCIKAMPHIQALFEIFKEEDDVIVLGINSWEREKDKVEPFLKEHKITYRILLDSNDEVIGKYGVRGIPTFFLIDKKGIIRYSYTGMPSNRQIIQQNLEELLTE